MAPADTESVNVRDVQAALNGHGFPCSVDGSAGPQTKAQITRFQAAYCGPGGLLSVDGIAGPRTQDALAWTVANNALVSYFSIQEVACPHCGAAYVKREALGKLFILRQNRGRALRLISAYRCLDHNRAVGGAVGSEHLKGEAFDIPRDQGVTLREARLAGFGGVGAPTDHFTDDTIVTHVDNGPNRIPFFDKSVG